MIVNLSAEQEACIPIYLEKWRAIAYSTETIDCQKVSETIKAAYKVINRREPEIQFFPSPYAALLTFADKEDAYTYFDTEVAVKLENQVSHHLHKQIKKQIQGDLILKLYKGLSYPLAEKLWSYIWDELKTREELGKLKELGEDWCGNAEPSGDLNGTQWAAFAAFYDFCFSVLKCSDGQSHLDAVEHTFSGRQRTYPSRWEIFQSLAQNCGWFFPLDGQCLVSDRPKILSLDSEYRLHAQSGSAIIFSDGFSICINHGERLHCEF